MALLMSPDVHDSAVDSDLSTLLQKRPHDAGEHFIVGSDRRREPFLALRRRAGHLIDSARIDMEMEFTTTDPGSSQRLCSIDPPEAQTFLQGGLR